jgi:stage IV sporulation protein FB
MKLFGTPLILTRSFFFGFVYFSIAIAWNNTWIEGISITAALFGIVFLHEVGHLVVSKLVKIPAKNLTLMVTGGMVEFYDDYEQYTPWKKLLITLGGPLVNVIIMFIIGFDVNVVDGHPDTILDSIKAMNIVLLLFNILPLYSLDGGRIIQTLIELKVNNFELSKYYASIISVITSLVVITLSVTYWSISVTWLIVLFTILIGYSNISTIKKYRNERNNSERRSE